jgi:hypothetical protein
MDAIAQSVSEDSTVDPSSRVPAALAAAVIAAVPSLVGTS